MAFQPKVSIKNILITGTPGVGKTTCIRHVIDALLDKHNRYFNLIEVTGFYSLERRQKAYSNSDYPTRIGFDVISVPDGKSEMLARTEQKLPQNVYNRYQRRQGVFQHVGKYIVDVQQFERFVLPLLSAPKANANKKKQAIFIIDEIGKMELFSQQFQKYVDRIINQQEVVVIATVPLKHNIHFVDRLKKRKDSKLFTLTRNNRTLTTTYITKCVFDLIGEKIASNDDEYYQDNEEQDDNDWHDEQQDDYKQRKQHNKQQSTSYYNSNQMWRKKQ